MINLEREKEGRVWRSGAQGRQVDGVHMTLDRVLFKFIPPEFCCGFFFFLIKENK